MRVCVRVCDLEESCLDNWGQLCVWGYLALLLLLLQQWLHLWTGQLILTTRRSTNKIQTNGYLLSSDHRLFHFTCFYSDSVDETKVLQCKWKWMEQTRMQQQQQQQKTLYWHHRMANTLSRTFSSRGEFNLNECHSIYVFLKRFTQSCKNALNIITPCVMCSQSEQACDRKSW